MDVFDILLAPIYLIAILVIGYKYTGNKLKTDSTYKYFMPGLIAKIGGAIALGLVYFFYYGGGDTVNYFQTANAFVDLLFDSPSDFFYVFFNDPTVSELHQFRADYTFVYWVNDQYAFFVAKCYFLIALVCGKTYMACTMVTATVCYLPVWRLYLVFIKEFPEIPKQLAWSVLFIPSVIFWGGGLMKDSITFSSTCLYVHGFYWFFTQRQFKLKYLFALFLASYLLVMIKPYILVALIPGSALWFTTQRISNIKSAIVRTLFIPVLLLIGLGITNLILQQLGEALGKYSMDNVLNTAANSQHDLKQDYYKGNSFDIGDYEPTLVGALSVAHKAIFAALYRPTLLDVKNPFMLISAVENLLILLLSIYLLIKLRVLKFFSSIYSHPLLLFSFIFSVFFAFSVGLSVANFGTLVRLKIPCIPFFVSVLVILNHQLKQSKPQASFLNIKQ